MDITYNIENTDSFCHASLLLDIGEGGQFLLIDKNFVTLAYATVIANASAAPSTTPKPVGCTFQYDETTNICTGISECKYLF